MRAGARISLVAAAIAAAAAVAPVARGGIGFVAKGGGWGHGVGLGQWGAEGYALHGRSYLQILEHYYPHTSLARLPGATVRVLLLSGARVVTIGSRQPFVLVDGRGRRLHVQARLVGIGPALRVSGRRLVPPVQVEAGAAVLSLDGRGYRGMLTLVRSGGRLEVVNSLPLERYLRGVVPAEMPKGWSTAAYAAQAIAARSYALARLGGGGAFDLYADERDQMYGGIAAERPETNAAVDDTAGQVLTYAGRPILAYYSSSTGGRSESVHAAFAARPPEPYLVSVADPYDVLSPQHRWQVALDPDRLDNLAGFAVLDIRVHPDAAGHAKTVALIGARARRTLNGRAFAAACGLRSTRFSIAVFSIEAPTPRAVFGQTLLLRGFVRGLHGVVLQQLHADGAWQAEAPVRADAKGRFAVAVRPTAASSYRLAVPQLAGPAVTITVSPRLDAKSAGDVVTGTVKPPLPLQVERQANGGWHPLRKLQVGPSGFFRTRLRPGRYRLDTASTERLSAASSPPLTIVH